MKLLFICQYFYPEQFRVSDVCFELVKRGHDVTVLTGLPNYPMGEIFPEYQWDHLKTFSSAKKENSRYFDPHTNCFIEMCNGVKVIRVQLFPRKTGKKNLAKNYLSFALKGLKAAKKMCSQDTQLSFDHIIVFQYSPVTMLLPAIYLKKQLFKRYKTSVPLVAYCFDLWPESIVSAGLPNHGFIYNMIKLLSKWLYKKSDLLLISSKNFSKYFYEKLDIKKEIHYLPIYAEEVFSVNTAPKHETIENRICNFVFAGNIGEMQSVETIIKAVAHIEELKKSGVQVSEIQVHIVGDGTALHKCKQLSIALGLNENKVIFYGRHPLEQMPSFYQMADAFLVTLKDDTYISYTLPGKVQSYMAFGKPIIASIGGETATVITEAHCGLCCPPEDAEGLADIMLDFAKNKEKHAIYGANSLKYYKKYFSKEAFYQSFFDILTT